MLKLVKTAVKKVICFFIYSIVAAANRVLSGDRFLKLFKYKIYTYLPVYSIKKYVSLKHKIEEKTIRAIAAKKKIQIGFVVYTGAMWFFDELYKLLCENDRYDVKIIIGHLKTREYDASEFEYQKACRYFQNKGFDISNIKDIENFDILFYLTPYSFFDQNLNLENVRLNKLVFHVSYSYMLSRNTEKLSFNMYHWSFRYYTDSEYYLKEIQKINTYSGNARYCGYPKMDQYYRASDRRISSNTTIIYAPHQSVDYKKNKAATFDVNYRFMLQLMEQYKDSVHWIYKPHPLLRDRCISAKLFDSYEAYDRYLEEMKATGCVTFASEGDYFDLFKASDAMITDSVSFLAEYQFTGKPLLLLMSGMAEYNEFGQSIVDILYKCKGDDYNGIQSFVQDILDYKDDMKDAREAYFRKNLDYMGRFKENANVKIYQDITSLF